MIRKLLCLFGFHDYLPLDTQIIRDFPWGDSSKRLPMYFCCNYYKCKRCLKVEKHTERVESWRAMK